MFRGGLHRRYRFALFPCRVDQLPCTTPLFPGKVDMVPKQQQKGIISNKLLGGPDRVAITLSRFLEGKFQPILNLGDSDRLSGGQGRVQRASPCFQLGRIGMEMAAIDILIPRPADDTDFLDPAFDCLLGNDLEDGFAGSVTIDQREH